MALLLPQRSIARFSARRTRSSLSASRWLFMANQGRKAVACWPPTTTALSPRAAVMRATSGGVRPCMLKVTWPAMSALVAATGATLGMRKPSR